MIRSIHKLLVAASEEDYSALLKFFQALGLAQGETWDGQRSRGAKFDAPGAGVEIGFGAGFPDADLVIEVENADVTYDVAHRHGFKVLEEIGDADWGARIFTLELPANAGKLAIYSYNSNWREQGAEGE